MKLISDDYGHVMTLKRFITDHKAGALLPDDGTGYYGLKHGHFENKPIDWFNIEKEAKKLNATHIWWYNK